MSVLTPVVHKVFDVLHASLGPQDRKVVFLPENKYFERTIF